jgi:hypothetical protein
VAQLPLCRVRQRKTPLSNSRKSLGIKLLSQFKGLVDFGIKVAATTSTASRTMKLPQAPGLIKHQKCRRCFRFEGSTQPKGAGFI